MKSVDRVVWARRHEGFVVVGIVVIGILPTLVWGVSGAGYLSDDYWIAYWLDDLGLREGMERIAFEKPGRPLAALYYAVTYPLIGEHGFVHAAVLATVNGAMLVALWRFGRRVLPTEVVLAALAVFAVLPNHGTTRLWFVVGTYPLAIALTAIGGALLLGRSDVAGGGALVAAILLYEGVAGFAAVVVVLTAWSRRGELRRVLGIALLVGLALALMLYLSPKRTAAAADGYPGPFAFADTLGPALFGHGLTDHDFVGTVLYVSIISLVMLGFAQMLPPFRPPRGPDRTLIAGVLVVGLCAAPMLIGGSQFAVEGINDRNNLMPSIGVSLIVASPFLRASRRFPAAAMSGLGALIGVFLLLCLRDVDLFVDSVDDGRVFERAVFTALGGPSATGGEVTVIVPEFAPDSGIAAFINHVDIHGALQLHHGGDWTFLRMVASSGCLGEGDVRYLDWRAGSLSSDPLPPC